MSNFQGVYIEIHTQLNHFYPECALQGRSFCSKSQFQQNVLYTEINAKDKRYNLKLNIISGLVNFKNEFVLA
ncbi:hypothetical protein P618_200318 [Holospora obtusa F1]|uniref:Uncharacterized protein n=1 Tax=Holospora obtusa F1 TaxID=1399147 RepID=W6TUR1_HOLOB|nr:hypothetical protein P618_200318 [Holospora obtusa F1]